MGRVITHPEAVLYTYVLHILFSFGSLLFFFFWLFTLLGACRDGGLRIPMGEDKRAKGGMGHNEFIVYNEGQVTRLSFVVMPSGGNQLMSFWLVPPSSFLRSHYRCEFGTCCSSRRALRAQP